MITLQEARLALVNEFAELVKLEQRFRENDALRRAGLSRRLIAATPPHRFPPAAGRLRRAR